MKLHHLEMTAFGPFAGTAEVDFDELSTGGVFLLTGATGAGKTSVLDAVCFALYGQVPGDRAGARHLRSDHAAPGAAPRVVLEASIGDRTFRFSRSPAWSRPKQRGSGETRVQAHVTVEERRNGEWVALTTRLDDAGLLVSDLLGMTAAQFTQVAMLPQGRFQAFLRASSTERHAVLQTLFRTDRFEQVERWLVDRRGAARRASEAAGQRVLEVLTRIQEVADVELPDGWADDLAGPAERAEIATWSMQVISRVDAHRGDAEQEQRAADAILKDAEAALEATRRVHDLRTRADSSARELVALTARSTELTALEERLSSHRRAAPLTALVGRSFECRRAVEGARERWSACLRDLHEVELHDDPTRERLAALQHAAVAARAVAEAFRPRAEELARAHVRESAGRSRVAALTESLAALDDAIAAQPAALAAARLAVAEAQDATVRVPVLTQDTATLEELVVAVGRRDALAADLTVARADLVHATEATHAARDAYLDVREARINGMAAELAGALAAGCACPVCGSATHPAPAHAGGTAAGRAQEDAARKIHEDTAFAQQGHELRVATLASELDGLTDRLAPVDLATLPNRLTAAHSALRAARSLAAEAEARSDLLAAVESRSDAAREARARAVVELATARQDLETGASSVAVLAAELDDLLGGVAPDLETLIARRAAECSALDRAIRAFTSLDEAERASADAALAIEAAAAEAGFEAPSDVAAALLSEQEAEQISATLTHAEAARLAAEQVLADPAVRAAAAQPAPDLDVAVVKQRLAGENAQAAASKLAAASTRSQRLVALDGHLQEELEAWSPLRAQHALVAGLSQLVEGKGPDNPLRIRLAAYVLSERLRQVVAAANERLARMTGHRYALEHTDDRGAGELRGGLSLRVRDDWNGVPRDPATLSGGETFVVSLALALGLADTVAHEAGGTDIDTLFIDEGFGSLDADTLEDVMDTLDTLRDGGRVVGLVSHVPELRSRVTTQLEVIKGRHGSSLRPVLAGS
jgi:exonuclease SbcC